MNQIKEQLGDEDFIFYDGSEAINIVVPQGLAAFKMMRDDMKIYWRKAAINYISMQCMLTGKTGVVAGHLMLWDKEGQTRPKGMMTDADRLTYTYFVYLDTPAETILERRQNDEARSRPQLSVEQLREWQKSEMGELAETSRVHGILFFVVKQKPTLADQVSNILLDFHIHSEEYNLLQAQKKLDAIVTRQQTPWDTVLVLDGDKTLAAEDTGTLVCKSVRQDSMLKDLFGGVLGYTYTAFRQATLLFEQMADDDIFEVACATAADSVNMYPAILDLLKELLLGVGAKGNVGAVVITSGLCRVWEMVLRKVGLSDVVSVIGGGRLADGFVVTPAVKGDLVEHLRDVHNQYVWAFGDSPLDLKMLKEADQAVVVVGDDDTRSQSMDKELEKAISADGLVARQAIVSKDATPRSNTFDLPLLHLGDEGFRKNLLRLRRPRGPRIFIHTNKAANKVLATPTRDAAFASSALRKAHGRIGWYLATEFMTSVCGLEPYSIQHVQGQTTEGYQLRHEKQTLIIAMMRGGEPMALGVSDAIPLAMFLHAKEAIEVKPEYLEGKRTVVLVDSVINSGETILDFVQHVREANATIQIVIIAGVVQSQFLDNALFKEQTAISLIAIRISDNKYKGQGNTDTGHRLFNTTSLD